MKANLEKHEKWLEWANLPNERREGRTNILPEIVRYLKTYPEDSSEDLHTWEAISETLIDQCLDNTFGTKYQNLAMIPEEELVRLIAGIIGPDAGDLCYATGNRQAAVLDLCSKVDMLLVVGAKNSSNSSRLMELGLEQGIPSHLIASVEDLEAEWFENIDSVGISSGASAPEVLVQGVVDWIKEKFAPVEIENFVKLVESTKFNLPKALQD